MSSTEQATAVAVASTEKSLASPSDRIGNATSQLAMRLRMIARLAGIIAVVISLAGLSGRYLESRGAVVLEPGVRMYASAALGMLASALAILILTSRTQSVGLRNVSARFLALIPIGLAVAALVRFAKSLSVTAPSGQIHWDLMAPNTAITLLILGVTILLSTSRSGRAQKLAQFGAGLGFTVGLLALLGYTYGVAALYSIGNHPYMAAPTAITITLLSVGLALLTTDHGFVALLASNGTGAIMLRRLLPIAILAPWFVGWVAARGAIFGWYGTGMHNVLFAAVLIAMLSTLLYINAVSLNRVDAEREQTKELLRQNSEQWQATFDCMSEGLSYHDLEYNVVGSNAAFQNLACGRVVHGEKCYRAVHGTNGPHDNCPMRRTLDSGKTEQSEIYEPLLDKYLLVRTDPVRDTNGNIFRIVHVVEDITDRKKAEANIRRLASIVEHSDDAIFSNDLNGTVQAWNRSAERIYGYTAEEAIGSNLSSFCPPDSRDDWKESMRRVQRGERIQNVERIRVRKDGSTFHASLSVSPLRDANGNITGCSAIVRDITDMKLAEAEIARRGAEAQRTRAELDAVIDSMGEGLFQLDSDGRVVFMNHACERMLGYTIDEIRGKSMHDVIHAQMPDGTHRPASECPLLRVVASGETHHEDEDFFQRKDRTFFPVEYTSSPLRVNGRTAGAVLSFRDVSERKRAEAERSRLLVLERQARRELETKKAEIEKLNTELEDRVRQRTIELEVANKELEAFSYSVSHDLRAPLRSLDGFSHILLDEYRDKLDEEGQDFLRRLRTASQHMGQLIDSLLQLSRVSRSEISREPVDLSGMARQIVSELQKSAPERQVEVKIAERVTAMADPRLTHVVLQNLLHNAWKFTAKRERACIEFGTAEKDGAPVMFVRDNGAGFDMNYRNKLFGAFQRLHATSEFEGSGIGLATVQRVVRRHGGHVWADGVPQQGATFYFTLA